MAKLFTFLFFWARSPSKFEIDLDYDSPRQAFDSVQKYGLSMLVANDEKLRRYLDNVRSCVFSYLINRVDEIYFFSKVFEQMNEQNDSTD